MLARASETAWAKGRVALPLAFLIGFGDKKIIMPRSVSGGARTGDAPEQFSKATANLYRDFYTKIKDNNGVKEVNVLSLRMACSISLYVCV